MPSQNREEKKTWYINNGVKGFDLTNLPRCQGAAAHGGRCKRPAIKGKSLCSIHAGNYRPGAPLGNRNNFVHGLHGKTIQKDVATCNALINNMKIKIGALTNNNLRG
jgi:hypothetical protein